MISGPLVSGIAALWLVAAYAVVKTVYWLRVGD
jgi:hypothetical protein